MLSLAYQIGKDVVGAIKGKFFDWEEKVKYTDMEYIHKSGLSKKLEDDEYKIRWSAFEKVESRKLDGWQIIYEIDEDNRVKYRIEIKDELVLMGKKD